MYDSLQDYLDELCYHEEYFLISNALQFGGQICFHNLTNDFTDRVRCARCQDTPSEVCELRFRVNKCGLGTASLQ